MSKTGKLDATTRAELGPQGVARFEHAGEWVAWTPGFGRFVCAGSDRERVKAEAIAAGVERPLLEWISEDMAKNLGDGA